MKITIMEICLKNKYVGSTRLSVYFHFTFNKTK